MAAIDLLNLEPQMISRDLSGKYILLYGQPKVGKTTLAAQFDKVLFAAFERGQNALNNVHVAPVKTWDTWKQIVRQLTKNTQLQEKFHTIVFDVIDIAYDLCEQYICKEHDVEQLKDIPYGAGYKMVDKEFESTLRELEFAGYCLVFISHETEKEQTRDNGQKYMQIVPSMPKRCAPIIDGLADVIGYLKSTDYFDNEGVRKNERSIYLIGDERFLAGSRFQPIAPKVEMTYDALKTAILDAIEKTAERDGTEVSNDRNPFDEPDFDSLISEAKLLWGKVIQKEKQPEATAILEEVFGKPTKFSEILPEDVSKLNQAISQIKSIL